MVRTRSETNLNRIFVDLCISPELRSKNGHIRNNHRQHHPPLPTLKPMKSNSCSDLTKTSQNSTQTSSLDDNQTETLDLYSTVELPSIEPEQSIGNTATTTVPLMPTPSTGFTVETPSFLTNRSISLFETPLINTAKQSDKKPSSLGKIKGSSLNSTASHDFKQQDYINRLSDRLKSRGHLRKFFLS